MNIRNFFNSKSKKLNLSHAKNLFAMSTVDGECSKSETEFITRLCFNMGLTQKDIQNVLLNGKKIPFVLPPNRFETKQQFYELVFLMMLDGKIKRSEMDLCVNFAKKLGFQEEAVIIYKRAILEYDNSGLSKADIIAEIDNKYGDMLEDF